MTQARDLDAGSLVLIPTLADNKPYVILPNEKEHDSTTPFMGLDGFVRWASHQIEVQETQLDDAQAQVLWQQLKDTSSNWNGNVFLPIEGSPTSSQEPCLVEDFWIFARGTTLQEVFLWFKDHTLNSIK